MIYTDQKLKQYNEREERFRLAVAEATANKSASINSIANKYRVSRTTLSRRIHGFKNTRNSHEKQQKFTNEEESLIVSKIQQMLQTSDQIPSKKEVLNICENVLKEKYEDKPPTEGSNFFKVGKNWIDRFLERHNDKLMINSTTTLSEYYRSEFLQRKRLRSDRGYKTSNSSSPSNEPYQPQSENQQPYGSYLPNPQQSAVDAQGARLPYQSQDSNGLVYQTAVDQSQMGSYLPASYPAHNPSTSSSYNQDWQFNNFQRSSIYPTSAPPPPLPQQQQNGLSYTQQMPPLLKPDLAKQQQPNLATTTAYSNPSYVYGTQAPLKPTFADHHQQQQQQQQQPPIQSSQHPNQQLLTPQSHGYNTGSSFSSYTFGQPQPQPSSSTESVPQQHPQQRSPDMDTMPYFQGQRFQYGVVREQILKELGKEHVDVQSVTKLVNLAFNQMEKDLPGSPPGYGMATY